MKLKKHESPHGTVMAVSMMKDEAPFLLEWFAHHLAVGFTDILVYTNDCTLWRRWWTSPAACRASSRSSEPSVQSLV